MSYDLRGSRTEQRHPHSLMVVFCVPGCTRASLMHSMVLTVSLFGVGGVSLYATAQQSTHCLCLLLWTQIRRSIMVRAADCRSAGPWFNSGWRSWFIFVTGSDNLTNQIIQMFNNMSPTRTLITTITRKSVKMVAELDNDTAPSRILDTTDRLEDCSTVAKAATATAVAVDTKACAAQGTAVLAQSQQFRTEAKDSSGFSLSDYTQATERIRSRHRGGPNTRTTYWRVAGQAREPCIPFGVCRVKSRAKSNTFDWMTRTSWSPTPQT